jgi:hypothetical protein
MNNIVDFDLNNVFQIYSKLRTNRKGKRPVNTFFNRLVVNVKFSNLLNMKSVFAFLQYRKEVKALVARTL